VRTGHRGPQRARRSPPHGGAGERAAGRVAAAGLRALPVVHRRAAGIRLPRVDATGRTAHRHLVSGPARRVAARARGRGRRGDFGRLGGDRAQAGHRGRDLRPGAERRHPGGEPVARGRRAAGERGGAGRSAGPAGGRARRPGRAAAEAVGRRDPGARIAPAAAADPAPRAGRGDPIAARRPAADPAASGRPARPADAAGAVRRRGELAPAGRDQEGGCARDVRVAGGEDVGMKRIDWNALDEQARSEALARPAQTRAAALRDGVARIIADVRVRGDAALRELSAKYDRCALTVLEGADAEFAAAEAALGPALKAAIREAAARIETFRRAAAPQPIGVDTAPGVRVERMLRPISRVGLYVPAGSAPLPSTALMLGVPARIAGCREVVLCSPARADGCCDEAVLYAARLTGVHKVFKLGGAQAIAAMAYGTESVPKCDKLFGPGNAWVTEAKLQVSSDPDGAAIDMRSEER